VAVSDAGAGGAAVLAALWPILFWMYRRRIFLRL
jgi:hypothetical protein